MMKNNYISFYLSNIYLSSKNLLNVSRFIIIIERGKKWIFSYISLNQQSNDFYYKFIMNPKHQQYYMNKLYVFFNRAKINK